MSAPSTMITTAGPIKRLPREVMTKICEALCPHCAGEDVLYMTPHASFAGRRGLVNLCLTSKLWRAVAFRVLHHIFQSNVGCLPRFVEHLAANPYLALDVRAIQLHRAEYDAPVVYPQSMMAVLRAIMGSNRSFNMLRSDFVALPAVADSLLTPDNHALVRMSAVVLFFLAKRVEQVAIFHDWPLWAFAQFAAAPDNIDARVSSAKRLLSLNKLAYEHHAASPSFGGTHVAPANLAYLSTVFTLAPNMAHLHTTRAANGHLAQPLGNIDLHLGKLTTLSLTDAAMDDRDLLQVLRSATPGVLSKFKYTAGFVQAFMPGSRVAAHLATTGHAAHLTHLTLLTSDNAEYRGAMGAWRDYRRGHAPSPTIHALAGTFPALSHLTISAENVWYPTFSPGFMNSDHKGGPDRLLQFLPRGIKFVRLVDVHAAPAAELKTLASSSGQNGGTVLPRLRRVELVADPRVAGLSFMAPGEPYDYTYGEEAGVEEVGEDEEAEAQKEAERARVAIEAGFRARGIGYDFDAPYLYWGE
ncbi:hypothetical protein B0T25DRAFT_563597 [Lasiosphaeria hispida]|uniref:F-box domain-containing protein n=1 Tax=Lasiosphaeria hispida TaxID=260671 RepID=A0AAJ0ML86_9PEZI|nr:hypothetical protein B0T25DRAFT_563597 [Lasiosphaeria hispida]